MSGELMKIQNLPMATMNDFVTVGQYLSKSGLLGINSAEQGFLVACTCHQTGISFIEFKQTYHIINNQLSKRSDKMQADFQKAGGVIEIVQKDSDGSIVKLTHGKTSYTSRCIWEEIKVEPFAKTKNYETPRKRMQMMWARAISDGVRTVFPEVAAGVYTPEEVETFDVEAPARATVTPEEATRMATGQSGPSSAKPIEATVSQPVYTAPVQPTVLHPVSPSPVAPIQPQQAQQMAQQQENEPTPFTVLNDQANLDYTICPVEGTLFRMPWAQMPMDYLEAAMSLNIDQKYKDEILKAKQQKGNA